MIRLQAVYSYFTDVCICDTGKRSIGLRSVLKLNGEKLGECKQLQSTSLEN